MPPPLHGPESIGPFLTPTHLNPNPPPPPISLANDNDDIDDDGIDDDMKRCRSMPPSVPEEGEVSSSVCYKRSLSPQCFLLLNASPDCADKVRNSSCQ